MKKSNALMLSYLFFLVSTMIARLFFKWDGLDRIAMATTVAGCFFSLSDYLGWFASLEKSCYENSQNLINSFLELSKIKLDTIEIQSRQITNAIETFLPYKDENKDIAIAIIESNKFLKEINEEKTSIQDTLTTLTSMNPKIEKGLKRVKLIVKGETILAVLGFIVFFMIVSFDYFVSIIAPSQSFITILAFAIIMYTYYRKEIDEEKWEHQLAKMTEIVERLKSNAQNDNEKAKELDLDKKLEEFRKMKETSTPKIIGE